MDREGLVKHLRWNAFLAMMRYELLWNIRKKKFFGVLIVAFVFATLRLFVPLILSFVTDIPLELNPDYVVETASVIGGFELLLFAMVVMMNSIAGEFESGSITSLLTKPISRTMVFLGKMFAGFLILLITYIVVFSYTALGGTILYGAQNNLHLLPLSLVGSIISTFVWASIVLALGALSKSSMISALGAFGTWMAGNIVTLIVSAVTEQAGVLNYLAGSGATGYVMGIGGLIPGLPIPFNIKPVSTGTDQIASNIVTYILHPSAEVEFFGGFIPLGTPLYVETLGFILLRSIIVASAYIGTFLLIAWFAFRRTEVKE